jgi:hypothetical protein
MPRKILSGPLEPVALQSVDVNALMQLRNVGIITSLENATVTLTLADTEYIVEIPTCIGYEFRARTSVDVRYAFASGLVATPTDPYLTLLAGEQFHLVGVFINPHVLYLATATPGTVVELLVYEV